MRLYIVVVQSLSRVQLLVTSWTAACEASLSSSISLQKCCQTQSLPKVHRTLMSSPVTWPVFTGLACLTVSSVPPPLCSYSVQTISFRPSLSLLAGHGGWSVYCTAVDWLADGIFPLFGEPKRLLLVAAPQWPLLMKPESAVREAPERSPTEAEMWAIPGIRLGTVTRGERA